MDEIGEWLAERLRGRRNGRRAGRRIGRKYRCGRNSKAQQRQMLSALREARATAEDASDR